MGVFYFMVFIIHRYCIKRIERKNNSNIIMNDKRLMIQEGENPTEEDLKVDVDEIGFDYTGKNNQKTKTDEDLDIEIN